MKENVCEQIAINNAVEWKFYRILIGERKANDAKKTKFWLSEIDLDVFSCDEDQRFPSRRVCQWPQKRKQIKNFISRC